MSRRRYPHALAALALLASFAAESSPASGATHDRLAALPPVMLWAWERPEDLRFLDPRVFGVAFLAGTVTLRGETASPVPRLQPLRLSSALARIAVVRLEAGTRRPIAGTARQRREAAAAIVRLARLPGVRGVQVDFDARLSERDFYADLLADVRAVLPDSLGLSMTALASWCAGDPWLARLPVDEVVAMLFRMGPEGAALRARLARGGPFPGVQGGSALGLSCDEPPLERPARGRLYVFNPAPWSPAALAGLDAGGPR